MFRKAIGKTALWAPQIELAPGPRDNLAARLDHYTVPGILCRSEGARIRCLACGHRCLISPGRRGVCRVRFNQNGQLQVPYGYTAGYACDPVEKKPFYHVHPRSTAFTFGMLGCDFHCSYCQNWISSQALRDAAALTSFQPIGPSALVTLAQQHQARLVVSSYNEPLITAEWAVAVFQKAKAEGMLCAVVSNGNATPEVLDYLAPWIVACKVDLKTFNDKAYRSLGGTLKCVTDTIALLYQRGTWLEVVTLLIAGFNDSDPELRSLTSFIASVSTDIPWHVTAFHPDYQMTQRPATTAADLVRAARIGAEAGLHYVYAGNLPGQVGEWENTRCPACQLTLIERCGFRVKACQITGDGKCPACQAAIPGLWAKSGVAETSPGDDWPPGNRRGQRPT